MSVIGYHYLGVDHSVANVARRYGTTVEALWRRNDRGREFASAAEWAASIRPLRVIRIEVPREELRWEWDLWDDVPGNPTLEEFCAEVNRERARLHRRHRPVGPPVTPEYLWNAATNHLFRHEVLMAEARAPGAQAVDVENVEADPRLAYVRNTDRAGRPLAMRLLLVPNAPYSRSRSRGAGPNVDQAADANTLHVQPHWIRELTYQLADVRRKTEEVRRLLEAEQRVKLAAAETLVTFSRLDAFLSILVEGRNNRVHAAAPASHLEETEQLRVALKGIADRVADAARRQREVVAPPARKRRLTNQLRDMVHSADLTRLMLRAKDEGVVVNDQHVSDEAKRLIEGAYQVALEAAAPWAHEDIERALLPDATHAASDRAQWLALRVAIVTPLFGNTPGPATLSVQLMQHHATRKLQQLVSGEITAAQAQATVRRMVARFVTQSPYVLATESAAIAEDLAYLSLLSRGAPAADVAAAAQRAEAALQHAEAVARAVPSDILFHDIMAVVDDQQLSLAARRVRLERLARDRLTSHYQGGAGASSAVLLLNLALLLSNAVQAGERTMPIEDAIVASLGCSLASATAVLQILARQSVVRGSRATSIAVWAESTLERAGNALSHVAAVVTILQSLYGGWSTWNEWGYSHPNALASAVLGVGSGALLYFGWLVAFPLASGVGIALAIASAAVALVGDEDPLTKTTFIHFVNELKTSRGIRRFVDFLIDHPDGQGQGSNLQLDLRDIAERAQRTRIPKAVWDVIPALQRLGFDLGEAQRFTDSHPTHVVGPAAHPERIHTPMVPA